MKKIVMRSDRYGFCRFDQIKFELSPLDVPDVHEFFKHHKDMPLRLELKRWRRERTLSQNSLFHAIIGEIAKNTGMCPEIVKQGIKEQYGEKVPGWKGRMMPKPSHLCNTKEMGQLIDGAIYEAAFLGIDVEYHERMLMEVRNNEEDSKR
ncbi:MAG: hypothetical protein K9L24_03680 [Spirochaetia bacterium]|nr:hypothetical protein [Spirochaetia bacterium]